jgi:crotonobetainyl-CoA:carnitine CoA-transferase CaiB-like acyl-CoA transferase
MLTTDGSPPPFQRGGMGDHNAGVSAAAAISAALYAREKTGEGQLVSTSLLRQGIYTLSFDLSLALRFGVPLQVADRRTMANPAINSYRDSEGRWFWLIGLEGERHWPHLARVVGHPEWIEDPRFGTPAERASNAAELIALLDAIFATKTREEWGKLFDAEGEMWWAPVQPAPWSRFPTGRRPPRSRRRPSTSSRRVSRAGWRPSTGSTPTRSCPSWAGPPNRSPPCGTAVS